MNRNYVAYAYVYVYVSYKNEILKKREDVGKRLGGYWEEVGKKLKVSVTGYCSCGWMEEKTIASIDLQAWSSSRRQRQEGQEVHQPKRHTTTG